MPRFRRINIDGQSLFKTENRIAGEDILPGTFVEIGTDNEFQLVDAPRGRMYVVDVDHAGGKGIMDPVEQGHTAVGNYVEQGREFALRFPSGTAVIKDQAITVSATGSAAVAETGDIVVGYSQETVTLTGATDDFIRVRIRQVAGEL